jgi:hypothetical protein
MSGETDQQRAFKTADRAAAARYTASYGLEAAAKKFGGLPASVGGTVKKRCVTDPDFAEQVRAMWDAMPTDPGRSFLAGVRIAQGYVEFGSDVFAKELADLEFEAAQEEADALIYSTVRTLPQPIRDALANPNRVAG